MAGVIGLGDLHLPWPDKKAVAKAIAYVRLRKPKYCIQLGDAYDFFSSSRFPRSLNVMTPEQEHKRGRAQAEEFWERLRAAGGKGCEYLQILGNHDERPLKRTLERTPEHEHIVREGLRHYWTFPGVKTIQDATDELIIDSVLYTHGSLKFGAHIAKYRMPVVTGHLHKGDVKFERISIPRGNRLEHRVIYEANAGYLGDADAIPLRYRDKRKIYPYTKGLFELDDYGPRFIPVE